MSELSIIRADHLPKTGERAVLCGPTGSGKTKLAIFLVERIPTGPLIVYNTKPDKSLRSLPKAVVCRTLEEVHTAIKRDKQFDDCDYIIFEPHYTVVSDPDNLDLLLEYHLEHFIRLPLYIDELYHFCKNGRGGQGLIGIITRGRAFGTTMLMATQRPAFIPLFALTESQRIYSFNLAHLDDKKRLGNMIPDFAKYPRLPKFAFWYYRVGEDRAEPILPIALDPKYDTGYTEDARTDETTKGDRLRWI